MDSISQGDFQIDDENKISTNLLGYKFVNELNFITTVNLKITESVKPKYADFPEKSEYLRLIEDEYQVRVNDDFYSEFGGIKKVYIEDFGSDFGSEYFCYAVVELGNSDYVVDNITIQNGSAYFQPHAIQYTKNAENDGETGLYKPVKLDETKQRAIDNIIASAVSVKEY